jgi:hypothetical protein
MAQFKTTYTILQRPDYDELHNRNIYDSDRPTFPPQTQWTYDREMQIEDVDIWEVLHESSGGLGVYVSWSPYAEFYMITTGWYPKRPEEYVNQRKIETYYGSGAQQKVLKRARDFNMVLETHKIWVDDSELWLYQPTPTPVPAKIII